MVILTPKNLKTATAELSAADSVMKALIERHPPLRLGARETPFHTVATSIINQQLSQKAAAAIQSRLETITSSPLCGDDILRLSETKMRKTGLSASKARYLKNLAVAERDGLFTNINRLQDDEVSKRLIAVPGIGLWTTQMFLMFSLRRADILSPADAGLRRAAVQLYGKRFSGDDATILEKAARRWRPWRTVACRYLWRSLS